jgi:hypothetical protein
MIHVWKPLPHENETYCGAEDDAIIEPEELQRRTHRFETICPACLAKARPKGKYESPWKNPSGKAKAKK